MSDEDLAKVEIQKAEKKVSQMQNQVANAEAQLEKAETNLKSAESKLEEAEKALSQAQEKLNNLQSVEEALPASSENETSAVSDSNIDTEDETTNTDEIPPVCGNNIAEGNEECDGTDIKFQSCAYLMIQAGLAEAKHAPKGTPLCTAECKFDLSECSACGNGVKEKGEFCDSTEHCLQYCNGCEEGFEPEYDDNKKSYTGFCDPVEGFVATPDPELTEESVPTEEVENPENLCGNGVIDEDELCDKANFNGKSKKCADLEGYSFIGGNLYCNSECNDYRLNACYTQEELDNAMCGDGKAEGKEQCDGDDIPITCEDLNYDGGEIGCYSTCFYNVKNCINND